MTFLFNKKFYLVLITVFLFAGCGGKEAPDPPHAEGSLVIEMFSALHERDYTLAAAKVKRLKMLNPDDVNIASIEYQVKVDSGLFTVQTLLNDNKPEEANKLIGEITREYGAREGLIKAQKVINIVLDTLRLTERIQNAKTSSKIAIAAGELNRLIQKNSFLKSLMKYTEYSLDRARELMSIEDILAFRDLEADFDLVNVAGDSISSTIMAQIAVEEPLSEMPIGYEKMLSKRWEDLKLNSSIVPLGMEQLYFRQALVTNNKDYKDQIYKKMLNTPPGSFSSMLIRSYILNYKGFSKEGKALASIIDNNIGRGSRFSQYWFNFSPDLINIKSLKSVNPFVLYPFFVYCGTE